MGYRVVSRFFDRVRQVYVDPGASCPHLDPAEAKRLVGANCLVEVADDAPPANPLRRRRDAPPAPEAPAPTGAGE